MNRYKCLLIGLLLFSAGGKIYCQSEQDLKTFFEGKMIIVQMDLPGSTQGIYIYPEGEREFDYNRYVENILVGYTISSTND